MPSTHVRFHSSNGKRTILIIDNDQDNQVYLHSVLARDYDVLIAGSGEEGFEIIRQHREPLSLVLLGLKLPGMHGFDVIRQLKNSQDYSSLPVIVVTAYKDAEVESLTLGAMDFMSKPFPRAEIVRARVVRAIELSEDRDIIHLTERDHLTGLYNRDYFYRYAEQFDTYHMDTPTDAIVIDINRFHMMNERYGKSYGDKILYQISNKLKDLVKDSGGIVCRRMADTFLLYCPHREDYSYILESASCCLKNNVTGESRVRLRMGVYMNTDKAIDIERRFDRAKMAADSVRGNYSKAIGFYDDNMHSREIFTEQLIEDFPKALVEHQFKVYYQPKFNIHTQEPILSSAEALVRWEHPDLGFLSPALFIPLFERNGLIQDLDYYVWRTAIAQMRDWRDRLGVSVPVSVNISRVNMYDTDLIDKLCRLLREYALSPQDLLLEITESAYADSEQVIQTARKLQAKGFRIEMDDFGSGYSSLNMIAAMPVDALKLDIEFIRNAFSKRKDTRMLEIIIDLADTLQLPTIAEGVETAEQLFTLRSMGCDYVQGYYFSKPIPPEEYESYLLQRKAYDENHRQEKQEKFDSKEYTRRLQQGQFTHDALHDPLTGLYNQTAFEMILLDWADDNVALLVANVADFQEISRKYGPEVGEQMICKMADVLRRCFRSVDFLCRVDADSFIIIMSRVNSEMRKLVYEKIERVNGILRREANDLPPIRLCVGVAFSDRENPEGDILHDAETALNHMKEIQHHGCVIY
jgi:diguanylate cyclase (GGDEF)-like protein